jgi:hypothetical protein
MSPSILQLLTPVTPELLLLPSSLVLDLRPPGADLDQQRSKLENEDENEHD